MQGDILDKVEDAFVNYLSSSFTGSVVIYRGTDWREQDEQGDMENTIICYASGGEPMTPYLNDGNWRVNTNIFLRVPFNGEQGTTDYRNLKQELKQRLYSSRNLVNELTGSTSGLSIYEISEKDKSSGMEEDCYASNMTLEVVCLET